MKLYKYMSPIALKCFLENPSLRLTPRKCLNDPFEVNLPKIVKDKLTAHAKDNGKLHSKFNNDFQKYMDSHGILSLTETNDNLLMWSHYADEHRGAVVELNIDESKPLSLFNSDSPPAHADAEYGNVKYKKFRGFSDRIGKTELKNLRRSYYFSKSDEWIYEKEYRFLLPFTMAAKILVNSESSTGRELSSKFLSDTKFGVSGRATYFSSDIDIETRAKVWHESHLSNAMFFLLLNETCISSIYLGANANLSDILPAIKECSESNPYMGFYCPINGEYFNVFRSKLHENRYELKFSKVSDGSMC